LSPVCLLVFQCFFTFYYLPAAEEQRNTFYELKQKNADTTFEHLDHRQKETLIPSV
jgi:hypothetical protein